MRMALALNLQQDRKARLFRCETCSTITSRGRRASASMKSMRRQSRWSLAMLFTTLSLNSVVARWMTRRLMSPLIIYPDPLVMRSSSNPAKIKINSLTHSGSILLRRLMDRILLAKISSTSLNTLITLNIKFLAFYPSLTQYRQRNRICCYS